MELAPVVSEAAGGWREGWMYGWVCQTQWEQVRFSVACSRRKGWGVVASPACHSAKCWFTLWHTQSYHRDRQTDRRTQTDVGWGRDGGGRGKREGKREAGWVRGTERVLKATGDVRRNKSFTGYIRFNWYKKILKAAHGTPRKREHTSKTGKTHTGTKQYIFFSFLRMFDKMFFYWY